MLAGFIVGFDNDTPETFELQYRFITESGIQTAMIGRLAALPKTPLYERLAREGRLRDVADDLRQALTGMLAPTLKERFSTTLMPHATR